MLAPWHPGFGHSERPKAFTKIDDLAYFYLDFAEQCGLNNAVLAGASFGGWIAMEMAVRSSARFRTSPLGAAGFKAGDTARPRDIFASIWWGRDWPHTSSPTSRCCRITETFGRGPHRYRPQP